jgi:D-tyrosyl-tRNA(Tyr) deacylase
MRVVVQRVAEATVAVGGEVVAAIGPGLVALVGVAAGDREESARALAEKTVRLRIFAPGDGGAERSVAEIGGAVLVVSQFTLLGDTRRGNRPSWSAAAPAGSARPLVELYGSTIRAHGVPVADGVFGAHMTVALVNDGPVTLLLEDPA